MVKSIYFMWCFTSQKLSYYICICLQYRTLKRPIEGDSNSEKSAAIYPMDLGKIEANVYNKRYVSTREFYSDIKWIYHNCFILLNKTDQRKCYNN